MPNTLLTLSRRALLAAAVVLAAGATACGEPPSAPTAGPRASAVSKAKGPPPSAPGRRGGYNVVAD
jgi:hypothetical protein